MTSMTRSMANLMLSLASPQLPMLAPSTLMSSSYLRVMMRRPNRRKVKQQRATSGVKSPLSDPSSAAP